MMASALTRSAILDLDYLLKQIIEDLQLTPTQYREAVEHYEAVGRYLDHPRSPLAHLRPQIFPQGSMALQTTVKPIGRQEYDLDLVSQTLPSGQHPMWLLRSPSPARHNASQQGSSVAPTAGRRRKHSETGGLLGRRHPGEGGLPT